MIMKSCVACIFISLYLERQAALECEKYDKRAGENDSG